MLVSLPIPVACYLTECGSNFYSYSALLSLRYSSLYMFISFLVYLSASLLFSFLHLHIITLTHGILLSTHLLHLLPILYHVFFFSFLLTCLITTYHCMLFSFTYLIPCYSPFYSPSAPSSYILSFFSFLLICLITITAFFSPLPA